MRRLLCFVLILCSSLLITSHSFAQTSGKPNISVTIQSPESVKEYPGFETKIKAKVTNNTIKRFLMSWRILPWLIRLSIGQSI